MLELNVIKMGNPLLRERSKTVKEAEVLSNNFQEFITNLITTMRAQNGVGIAAPQVGIKKRVFIMEVADNSRYPNKKPLQLCVAINPEIEILDLNDLVDSWEGCLSIPGVRGCLKRYNQIKLKATDTKGKPFEIALEGFPAIIAQHELDHLNGVLFIDRMEDLTTLTFEEEYQTYWQ